MSDAATRDLLNAAVRLVIEEVVKNLRSDSKPGILAEQNVWHLVANALESPDIRGRIASHVTGFVLEENKATTTCETEPATTVKISLTPSSLKYSLIPIRQAYRSVFPGYEVPFTVDADGGPFIAKVTGASAGTLHGDPRAGNFIKSIEPGALQTWYTLRGLGPDGSVMVDVVEPLAKYRLRAP